MKVQRIQQNNIDQTNNRPQFKGVGDVFLRYLATNQAVGANAVDVGFMVIPRTGTDLIQRGPAAGLETGRREASGTTNHSLVGVYGAAAGALIAALMGFNGNYGVCANDIMAAKETVNILAENKAKQLINNTHQIDYIKETLSNLKAYNPTALNADGEGFVKLSQGVIDEVSVLLDNAINDKKLSFNKWNKKGVSNSFDVAVNKIIENTGAESKYILESHNKEIISETGLKTLIEDIYKVSEAFNRPNVVKAFKEQIENGKTVAENKFIKSLTKFSKNKGLAGFAIASAVGMSVQPLNVYLTKKKTGSDGFVGVEGRQKDDSVGFKVLKAGASAGFFAMVLATLNTGLKGFMDKMAFKGFWPTISQLKGIYGLTIISRLLATRDKDELRESLTKDTLGYLSWLVLGDIVNKLTATALDDKTNTVLNTTQKEAKGLWQNVKRAFNATLKTRDEILIETLAKNNIATTKEEGGKVLAKTFKEMMKDLNKLPEATRKVARKRLGTLNKAQLAGYAFSGLVLGLGIPNLNIFITNTLDKKRKAKLAEEEAKQSLVLAKA